jgi:chorismate mutase
MALRGVRGATVVLVDQADVILDSTRELLQAILDANPTLQPADLASGLFTLTEDLSAAYPAQAARQLGWSEVPLMCAREIPVPGSLPRCIRVLLHWNTDLPQIEIQHVYLGDAAILRPDLFQSIYSSSRPGPGNGSGKSH